MPLVEQFNKIYDAYFVPNTNIISTFIHCPHSFEVKTLVYYNIDYRWSKSKVIIIPIDEELDLYVIQDVLIGDTHQLLSTSLNQTIPHQSEIPPDPNPFPYHQWIHHKSKVTLFFQPS